MGFYLKKSLTVGPFRFNLSNSGIGLSTGVKGFRIGTGPRGHYVHAGRGGLYYRTSLGGSSADDPQVPAQERGWRSRTGKAGTVGPMEDFQNLGTSDLASDSQDDIQQEIDRKAKLFALKAPALAITIMAVLGSLWQSLPSALTLALATCGAVAVFVCHRLDQSRKTASSLNRVGRASG